MVAVYARNRWQVKQSRHHATPEAHTLESSNESFCSEGEVHVVAHDLSLRERSGRHLEFGQSCLG